MCTNQDAKDAAPVHQPPTPLIRLDSGAILVEDADEEVFDIYANLATREQEDKSLKAGLGHVSANEAIFHVEFDLCLASRTSSAARATEVVDKDAKQAGRRGKTKNLVHRRGPAEKTVSADIAQDLASLRNRKGDTGSVIWRSSLFLAKQILQLRHFPVSSTPPFLCTEQASTARVLELGAGTGVLAVLLHQLFLSWTASDQYDHLKLIARNVKQNGDPKNVHVEEIDWMDIHAKWIKAQTTPKGAMPSRDGLGKEYDLIVAVDCIYNEALVPPFLSTLECYATPGKTVALVVCELRSADVITVFLEEWISRGGWTIYRLSDMALGAELKYNFVAWVAWKTVG
ncbi:Ribosomal protein lysine methyltransferase [Naganishia albida]|nr:Ribosomal protein lysine methyltransferase [Naganishia albida]